MLYKTNKNQKFREGDIVLTNIPSYPNQYKVRHYNAGWDEYYLETLEGVLVDRIFYRSDLLR